MKLVGAGSQVTPHQMFYKDVSLTNTTPVLVLPRATSRSFLAICNTGSTSITVDFGYARAGAVTMTGSIPNQQVSSVAVLNAGQGYSFPPKVYFFGGGAVNPAFQNSLGTPLPEEPAPANTAAAHCVMSGSAPNQTVSSIVIDNPGNGYLSAPLCYLLNDPMDPNGCVAPSATTGILLPAGSAPLIFNGTCCPTDPVVVVGANTGTFSVRYMT